MSIPLLFLDSASCGRRSMGKDEATKAITTLLDVLKSLRRVNKKISLNCDCPVGQLAISTEWTISALLGGNEFKEEWGFIRDLNARSPIGIGLEQLRTTVDGAEFKTDPSGIISIAVVWAILADTGIVSLVSHPDWSEAYIVGAYRSLGEDADILEQNRSVRNMSLETHVVVHEEWLGKLGFRRYPNVEELWEKRDELFPSVILLPNVKKNLEDLVASTLAYRQALDTLTEISTALQTWDPRRPIKEVLAHATPEGETRKRVCWFKDPFTGEKELFDMHVRFTGGIPGRIHFRTDGSGSLYVAYIGWKIPDP